MALRNIMLDGEPILKKKCRPVTKFDARLAQLLDDMKETMMDASGLGLAAPQVGIMRRAFVVVEEDSLPPLAQDDDAEAPGNETAADTANAADDKAEAAIPEPVFVEFINPEVIETEDEVLGYEGCLSFPGKYAAIKRPTRAVVRAQDRNGEAFTYEAHGLMARCVCHETNHLDGITIDDLAEFFYDPENPRYMGEDDTEGEADEAGAGTEKAAGDAAPEET
ncbi:MAG: peptide deformylase [Ruminococcaceae bacterium]|nr:peptide deformylase [Oscillospiraceae bacterium]